MDVTRSRQEECREDFDDVADVDEPRRRHVAGARAGDPVVLWGDGLPVEEVAAAAGTISYELFCRLTGRVKFRYEVARPPDED